jgi:hypothetical protein
MPAKIFRARDRARGGRATSQGRFRGGTPRTTPE